TAVPRAARPAVRRPAASRGTARTRTAAAADRPAATAANDVRRFPLQGRAPRGLFLFMRVEERHHTTQRFARTIAESALQPKACANSPMVESGPITRYLPIGCGSPCTIS